MSLRSPHLSLCTVTPFDRVTRERSLHVNEVMPTLIQSGCRVECWVAAGALTTATITRHRTRRFPVSSVATRSADTVARDRARR